MHAERPEHDAKPIIVRRPALLVYVKRCKPQSPERASRHHTTPADVLRSVLTPTSRTVHGIPQGALISCPSFSCPESTVRQISAPNMGHVLIPPEAGKPGTGRHSSAGLTHFAGRPATPTSRSAWTSSVQSIIRPRRCTPRCVPRTRCRARSGGRPRGRRCR